MKEPDDALNELSRRVIGAALEVHRTLGPGFLDSAYESALCIELQERRIPHVRQPVIELSYKGQAIGDGRMDLLVDSWLVVELKSVESLLPLHTAQLVSYLRSTGHVLGLLINFNTTRLEGGIRRVVLSESPTQSRFLPQ